MSVREGLRRPDPDDMTPEERSARVVKLLARAVYRRICEEREKGEAGVPGSTVQSEPEAVPDICPPRTGRIPFGQSGLDGKRVVNPEEQAWILRVRRWAEEGLSSEAIAKQLNKEDRTSRRAGKWSRVAVWRILKGK